jgi:hypothetical protein
VVGDERDRAGVRAEGRAGEREPAPRVDEGLVDRGAPGAVVRGVVQLVQHHERVAGQPRDRAGAGRHLLVGRDDPVHVARQAAVGGRPRRVEMQREGGGGPGPLALEVRGGGDDDEPRARPGQLVARGGQREGRLAGAGRGDGQEVGLRRGDEAVERGLLPRPQANRTRQALRAGP